MHRVYLFHFLLLVLLSNCDARVRGRGCRRMKLIDKCKNLERCIKFYSDLKSRCMKHFEENYIGKHSISASKVARKGELSAAQDHAAETMRAMLSAKILSGIVITSTTTRYITINRYKYYQVYKL